MPYLCALVLSAFLAFAQPASDTQIWDEYARWTQGLKPLPPGQRARFQDSYIKSLIEQGVPKAEAERRAQKINELRRASPEREAVYWNAGFKLGAGPDDPLPLLLDAVYKLKPGRALDPGMGRGRNAIWLAANGWDVTGYDMAADALDVAQAYAAKAGVKIRSLQATHESFDFGQNQWDLIVCSYNYMRLNDPKLPAIFLRALRPGGLVVYQSAVPNLASPDEALGGWKQFRLIRYELLDPGIVDKDWTPSVTNHTLRVILRKPI